MSIDRPTHVTRMTRPILEDQRVSSPLTNLPLSDATTVKLQEDDDKHRRKRDSRLNAQNLSGAGLFNPLELNIRCHESTPDPTDGHPGADLAGLGRVAIEQVGVDGGGDDHDAETLARGEDG